MEQRRVVLLLPGQGNQRERMAAGLHGVSPEFTAAMSDFFQALGAEGERLREQWSRPAPNPEMDDGATAQPLLFAVGYALGRAVRADVLLGHSIGELAAACLAEVFAPEDFAALMAARARAMAGSGGGGMLAVAAAPDDLPGDLVGVTLAAHNGPRQTVLAGQDTLLDAAADRLRANGFTVRRLRSGHAFHSPVMSAAAQRLGRELGALRLSPPRVAVMSTRTAAPVRPVEAVDPSFWFDQLTLPVRFWPAVKSLLDTGGTEPGLLLLDASPDRGLGAAVRRHPAVLRGTSQVLPLLAPARDAGTPADAEAFAGALRVLQAEQAGSSPSL